MRVLLWVLIVATTLAVVWSIFLVSLAPLGITDLVWGLVPGRPRGVEHDQLATEISRRIYRPVQGLILVAVLPVALTGAAWVALGLWSLRAGDASGSVRRSRDGGPSR